MDNRMRAGWRRKKAGGGGGGSPSNFSGSLSLVVSHDSFLNSSFLHDPVPRSLKENSTKTEHQNATTPTTLITFTQFYDH